MNLPACRKLFRSRDLHDPDDVVIARCKRRLTACAPENNKYRCDQLKSEGSGKSGKCVICKGVICQKVEGDDYACSKHIENTVANGPELQNAIALSSESTDCSNQHTRCRQKRVLSTLSRCFEALQWAKSLGMALRPCFRAQRLKWRGSRSEKESTGDSVTTFEGTVNQLNGKQELFEESHTQQILNECLETPVANLTGYELDIQHGKILDVVKVLDPDPNGAKDHLSSEPRIVVREVGGLSPRSERGSLCLDVCGEDLRNTIDILAGIDDEVSPFDSFDDSKLSTPAKNICVNEIRSRSVFNLFRDEDDLRAYHQWHWVAHEEFHTLQEQLDMLHALQQVEQKTAEALSWPARIQNKIQDELIWWKDGDQKRQQKLEDCRSQWRTILELRVEENKRRLADALLLYITLKGASSNSYQLNRRAKQCMFNFFDFQIDKDDYFLRTSYKQAPDVVHRAFQTVQWGIQSNHQQLASYQCFKMADVTSLIPTELIDAGDYSNITSSVITCRALRSPA